MPTFLEMFPRKLPLIGMVHLLPLPGSPRYGGDLGRVERRALADARILEEEGFDGIVIENYGDAPFLPGAVGPDTVASMSVVAARLAAETRFTIGVNVLRNDARSALAVAAATGASFLRVNVHTGVTATDQGVLEGRAWETIRAREALGADVAVFADVLVKHGLPLGPSRPDLVAKDTVHRGMADAVLVTGAATGAGVDEDLLCEVKGAVPDTPVLVASGLTAASAPRLLPHADGAIVGTGIQRGGASGAPVDRRRARRLVAAVEKLRA